MHIKVKEGVIVRLTDEGEELVVGVCEADAIARANGHQFAEQFVKDFGTRSKGKIMKLDGTLKVTIKLDDWERAVMFFALLDPTQPRPIGKAGQLKYLALMMEWDHARALQAIDGAMLHGIVEDTKGK